MEKYKELAKRIGLGDSERIPLLFQMIADESEADMLLAMPGNAPALAEKLGRPEEEVSRSLHTLFIKGLVFPSKKNGSTDLSHGTGSGAVPRRHHFMAGRPKGVFGFVAGIYGSGVARSGHSFQ